MICSAAVVFEHRKSVFNRCVDLPTSKDVNGSDTAHSEAAADAEAGIDEERCNRDKLMASHSSRIYYHIVSFTYVW